MRGASLAIACVAARLAADDPEVATIQVAKDVFVTGVLATDVDGDGREDLVLALRSRPAGRRWLHVHLQQPTVPRFLSTPSLPPYAVETDVVAFTFADVLPAQGRELVLLTPERVVAVTHGADGAVAYQPLFDHRLLWPAADPDFVLPLPAARCDYDGDGRDDLLLGQPDGVRIALRPGSAGAGSRELKLPPWRSQMTAAGGSLTMEASHLRLALGGGDGAKDADDGPLASVRTRAPPGLLADLDGDGKPELGAVRNQTLYVGQARDDGTLACRMLPLPVPGDRLTMFDPSFDVQLRDVDGDRRADLLLTTSASRNDEIEVRIDLFVTRADGTWSDKPDSRLRVQPLAGMPALVDADGDGGLDLVVLTVRTDALRNLTGGAPAVVDAQLTVFRGSGGRFALPALLNQVLPLPATGERAGRPFVHVLAGSGGAPGVVLLADAGGLHLRRLERRGERLVLGAPSRSLVLREGARPQLAGASGGDVIVVADHEVLHVRMR